MNHSRQSSQVPRCCLLPALLFFCVASVSASASLEVPLLFADHMVIQRERPVPVWGTAQPDQEIYVELLESDASVRASGSAVAGPDGRWLIGLPAQPASQPAAPLSLRIVSQQEEILRQPVHVGDVWICAGQSNMNFLMRPNLPWSEGVIDWESEVAAATVPGLSVFTVAPEASHYELDTITGAWRPAVPAFVEYFSAVPYYFGAALRREKDVPIGIIVTALGATSIRNWIDLPTLEQIPAAQSLLATHAQRREEYAEAIEAYYQEGVFLYRAEAIARMLQPTYAAPYPDPYPNWRYQPGGLFNAMLAPLEPFPVAGFAWYQGESDTTDHANYWVYLRSLIESWRSRRGSELPFLLVQLQNHDPVALGRDPAIYTDVWAALREAQARVLELPATGMAVTADVGDPLEIHPRDKKTVAERLALTARAVAYGEKDLVYSGPRPAALRVEGKEARIAFSHSGSGLVLDHDRASGQGPAFELAGVGREFVAAEARIEGDEIVLRTDAVEAPVHVRYAYHNDPRLILYNAEGLPAAPFRLSLPVRELGRIDFDALSPEAWTAPEIRPFSLETGPGIIASGFNTSRGTPPPSFFVRTTSTPETRAEAIAGGHYLELALYPEPGYRLDLRRGELTFDVARSTTTGAFGFAIRWSLDGFSTDLLAMDIESANEQFIPIHLPLVSPQFPDTGIAFRIYFWDNLHDSLRAVRVDSFRVSGDIAIASASGWQQWLQEQFPDLDPADEAVAGPGADPLGQGVPNLLRYALELPPSSNPRDGLPQLRREEPTSFTFRRDPHKQDIAYIVRSSPDLADWTNVVYDSRSDPSPNTHGDFMKIDLPESERLFLRLEVSLLD